MKTIHTCKIKDNSPLFPYKYATDKVCISHSSIFICCLNHDSSLNLDLPDCRMKKDDILKNGIENMLTELRHQVNPLIM